MLISCNHKNWKIFVDQFEYLNIATNLTSTLLLLDYVFKPNNKQYNLSFYQKNQ